MKAASGSPAKAAFHHALNGVHHTVANAELAALLAVERVEDTLATVKAGFDNAKAIGTEVMAVVDNAGRTTFDGMVNINASLVNYGKDAINDTLEVSKRAMAARTVTDVVALQTAYAERRITAVFDAMHHLGSLAQSNVMAMFSPFAVLARESAVSVREFAKPATTRAAEAVKSPALRSRKPKKVARRRKSA